MFNVNSCLNRITNSSKTLENSYEYLNLWRFNLYIQSFTIFKNTILRSYWSSLLFSPWRWQFDHEMWRQKHAQGPKRWQRGWKSSSEAEALRMWLVWLEDRLNTGKTGHVSKYFEAIEGIYKYRKEECLKNFRSMC